LYEEIDPDDLQLHDIAQMFTFLVDLGRLDEARALFDEHRAAAEADSNFIGLASGSFALGDTAASLAYLQQAEKIDPPPIIALIPLHALHGNLDLAFAYLEKAYDMKNNWVTRLGVYPKTGAAWAILAEDPRYEELMKKIGIRA